VRNQHLPGGSAHPPATNAQSKSPRHPDQESIANETSSNQERPTPPSFPKTLRPTGWRINRCWKQNRELFIGGPVCPVISLKKDKRCLIRPALTDRRSSAHAFRLFVIETVSEFSGLADMSHAAQYDRRHGISQVPG
jgi:hypothetical protein